MDRVIEGLRDLTESVTELGTKFGDHCRADGAHHGELARSLERLAQGQDAIVERLTRIEERHANHIELPDRVRALERFAIQAKVVIAALGVPLGGLIAGAVTWLVGRFTNGGQQ